WGTAANAWLETAPAPASAAGSSLERLPGGALGSGQDTDHNLVDFVVRALPDPQNSASPPVPDDPATPTPSVEPIATESPTPGPTPMSTPATSTPSPTLVPTTSPTSTGSPTASPSPTPPPSPTPGLAPITIAEARALPDDTEVVVTGITLSASDFTEGGGYLADATGGVAVLLGDGSFPRGVELIVRGAVDDRFAQRTLRATGADLTVGPIGTEPDAAAVGTGAVGEPVEGQLVTITGEIQGSATSLSAGLAYEVDDGSGPVRVLVSAATGIDTDSWTDGTSLAVTGVVGQRDSSGTGSEGYRVQPRDPSDVEIVLPPIFPLPSSTPSSVPTGPPEPSPSPTAAPSTAAAPLVTIAQARGAEANAKLRIRGVVTLPTNLVEEGSAVVADGSGAILVRAGSDIPRLVRGQLVELLGTRSTKSGMLSLRITQALVLGAQADSGAVRRATGRVGEADEALLVVVRGLVKDGPRRTTGGGLSLTVNDGSGALRVFVAAASGITVANLPGGAWVELSGVVGQQTTGAEPTAGYRLWPRDRGDIHVIATSAPGGSGGSGTGSGLGGTTGRPGAATPAPSVKAIRPGLGGSVAEAPPLVAGRPLAPALRGHVPPLPVPTAAGLGALAGLLVLAWRHGTWTRLHAEIGRRVAGGEEDESYTPAP
ncbi:MAG TPA: hypothetical protein VIC63_07435, partial [Candidatus Limnocylindria bacterium]